MAEVSIYQYFEQELDLQISFANKEIVAKKADDIDQKEMAIGPDDYIISSQQPCLLRRCHLFPIHFIPPPY
nr:UTRA domain-containing protein [Aerococcus viridans]